MRLLAQIWTTSRDGIGFRWVMNLLDATANRKHIMATVLPPAWKRPYKSAMQARTAAETFAKRCGWEIVAND